MSFSLSKNDTKHINTMLAPCTFIECCHFGTFLDLSLDPIFINNLSITTQEIY